MGITEVRREIRTAMADNHLTNAEADRITDVARRDFDGEVARELVDLFDKTNDGSFAARSPGAAAAAAAAPTATSESGASTRLFGLLIASNTPVGNNHYAKEQLILKMDFSPPVPRSGPPPGLDKMFPVELGRGNMSAGLVVATGYVDVTNQRCYQKTVTTKADGTSSSEAWKGPYDLRPLNGTFWDVQYNRRTPSDAPPALPQVSRGLTDRVVRFWMADNRYLARDFVATAPAGPLAERFLVGLSGGTMDSIVTPEGDESLFFIKRTGADGVVGWKGPFDATTMAPTSTPRTSTATTTTPAAAAASRTAGRATLADIERFMSRSQLNTLQSMALPASSFVRDDGAPSTSTSLLFGWSKQMASLGGSLRIWVGVDSNATNGTSNQQLLDIRADGSFGSDDSNNATADRLGIPRSFGSGGPPSPTFAGYIDERGTVHFTRIDRPNGEHLATGARVRVKMPGT